MKSVALIMTLLVATVAVAHAQPKKPQRESLRACMAKNYPPQAMVAGKTMVRFVPTKLAGHSPHARMVYPGKVIGAYSVKGGWANLDVMGGVTSVGLCVYRACTKLRRVKGHWLCVKARPNRYALSIVFGRRIQLALSAPKRATVLKMIRDIDLNGLARAAK